MKRVALLICAFVSGLVIFSSALKVFAQEPQPLELNNTEWTISLVPGEGQPGIPDKLIFANGQFNSEKFAAEGYAPTNYTLSLNDDGVTTIFETMQSTEAGDVGLWRGEIRAGVLRGVISFRKATGVAGARYTFSGNLATGELKPKAPLNLPPEVTGMAPVATQKPAVVQAPKTWWQEVVAWWRNLIGQKGPKK